jgi:hypothetical protein
VPSSGQFGQEGARDDVADPRDAGQEIELGAPDRARLDELVNGAIDALPLGFQGLQRSLAGALRDFAFGLGDALLLGIDHDDELAPGETVVSIADPPAETTCLPPCSTVVRLATPPEDSI